MIPFVFVLHFAPFFAASEECSHPASGAEDFFQMWDSYESESNIRRLLESCAKSVRDAKLEPISTAFPCSNGGGVPFKFSGGKSLDGRGQMTLLPNERKGDGDACVKVNRIFGQTIEKIDGNFSNGKLEGLARISCSSGFSLFSIFSEGIPGRVALIDGAGHLRLLAEGNRSWKLIGDGKGSTLLFTTSGVQSASNLDDLRALAVVRKGQVYAGRFFPREGYFLDATEIDGSSIMQHIPDCPLDLKANNTEVQNTGASLNLMEGVVKEDKDWRDNCNGLSGKSINALRDTYFSLSRDPLANFAPAPDDDGDFSARKTLFQNLHRKKNGVFDISSEDGKGMTVEAKVKHVNANGRPGGYAKIRIPGQEIIYEGFLNEGEFEGPILAHLHDGRFLISQARRNALHGFSATLGLGHLYTPQEIIVQRQGEGLPGLGMLVNYR